MAPGANPHADVAVRPDLPPVTKAGLLVQFPAESAVDDRLLARGNGLARTATRTFFADPAESLHPHVDGLVRNEREAGGHSA